MAQPARAPIIHQAHHARDYEHHHTGLSGSRGYHQVRKQKGEDKPVDSPSLFYWQYYWRLDGYYNGVRTLVSPAQYEPENRFNRSIPPTHIGNQKMAKLSPEPPLDPVRYDPYPDWKSAEYLKDHEQVHPCYLDAEEKVLPPDIYAYPGVPQNMAQPLYGSYEELGIEEDVCFERFWETRTVWLWVQRERGWGRHREQVRKCG